MLAMISAWRGPIEHQHVDRRGLDALCFRQPGERYRRRGVEFDHAFLVAGPTAILLHVDVGACSSVPPSAIAMVAIAPGMFVAHSVGAFQRIDGDIDLRPR